MDFYGAVYGCFLWMLRPPSRFRLKPSVGLLGFSSSNGIIDSSKALLLRAVLEFKLLL